MASVEITIREIFLLLIDKYLAKNLIKITVVVLALLLSVEFLLQFLVEQTDIGHGQYDTMEALFYVILCMPARLTQSYLLIALLSGTITISLMQHHQEIAVIQIAGMSTKRIIRNLILVTILLSVSVSVIGEFVAPNLKQIASLRKLVLMTDGQATISNRGFWLRNKGAFVYVKSVGNANDLYNIFEYSVHDNKLDTVKFIAHANYHKNIWQFQNVHTVVLTPTGLIASEQPLLTVKDFLPQQFLQLVSLSPEYLSISGLWHYINYLQHNQLDARLYRIALWKKILQPVITVVILFLTLPFSFGALRSLAFGKRMLLAMSVGISFYLCYKIISGMVQIYYLPEFLAPVLPLLLFTLILLLFRMKRLYLN